MKTSRQRARVFGPMLSVLFLVGSGNSVQAGPNFGGTLIVHEVELNATCEAVVSGPLSACAAVDNMVDSPFLCPAWKVYAAFPGNSQPRLKTLRWGISSSSDSLSVSSFVSPDPLAVDVVPTWGWPYSGTGVTMTFHTVQTAELVELFIFLGYNGYGSPIPSGAVWSTTSHPTESSVFLDDSAVPVEDPIADYGTLGFGVPGYTPCPEPLPVPAVETSWGRIKADYRR